MQTFTYNSKKRFTNWQFCIKFVKGSMSNAFKLITIPLDINIPTFTRKRVITYFNLSLLLLLFFFFFFFFFFFYYYYYFSISIITTNYYIPTHTMTKHTFISEGNTFKIFNIYTNINTHLHIKPHTRARTHSRTLSHLLY